MKSSNNEDQTAHVPSIETKPSPELSAAQFALCDLLNSGAECYCEGTGIHTGVNPDPFPAPGDVWEFKLPHMKSKRVKTVGSISEREFIIERATEHPWKHKTAMLPYVNWERQNKGRYTGVTARRLMEFGHRVSTQAERDARTETMMERARVKREQKRQATNTRGSASGTT